MTSYAAGYGPNPNRDYGQPGNPYKPGFGPPARGPSVTGPAQQPQTYTPPTTMFQPGAQPRQNNPAPRRQPTDRNWLFENYGYGSPGAQPLSMTAGPAKPAPQPQGGGLVPQAPMGNLGGDVVLRPNRPPMPQPAQPDLTSMLGGTPTAPGQTYNPQYQGWTANNPWAIGTPNRDERTGALIAAQGGSGDTGINWATLNNGAAPPGGGQLNNPGSQVGGMTEAQIAARGWAGQPAAGPASGPGGGLSPPSTTPGAGPVPNAMNISTVNQDTGPIYSDELITRNRNQALADMARVTPESAAKQFETPGLSRSAGTFSAALPQMAKFQAGALGNLANQEFGFRNANAQNQLDQQYRREMEGFGLANNEFGLQNAYGDLQDQARQRQINLLMSMLQGAGRLNTLGSYGGAGGGY